jgi:AhpD family alkylhydroperoxidase
VATPSNKPGRAEAFDAYHSDNGVGANRRAGRDDQLCGRWLFVGVRVSQINNCAYCLDMHTRDLLKDGMQIEKLALLQAWAEAATLFDERDANALRSRGPRR